MDFNKWFLRHSGFKIHSYQEKVLNDLVGHLNQSKPIVFAGAPSSGKTITSICFIDSFLESNPKSKVLVLAHGTDVLRSQYHDRLQKLNPDFNYCKIESKSDLKLIKSNQVVVTIPQTLKSIVNDLPKFDLVIIDEAHHFYISKEEETLVKRILRKVKPKHQLLLTGSPSKFIRREKDYVFTFVSAKTIFDAGQLSDVVVDLVSSKYVFKKNDYNDDGELKRTVAAKVTQRQTNDTMKLVVESILQRLKSRFKNDPAAYATIKRIKLTNVSGIFNEIGKTLIACKSIEMAEQVHKYLSVNGICSKVSHSMNDKKSLNFDSFINEEECKILIVVDRGILGFDLATLENVIDMTGSQNPDMIFQLKARVLRKHPENKTKLFIKVAPTTMKDYFRVVMNFTALLYFDEYYTKFNGKNFRTFEMPVCKGKSKRKSGNGRGRSKKVRYELIDTTDMPEIDFFVDVLHKNIVEFSSYAFANIGVIMSTNFGERIQWSENAVKAEAKKYDTIVEWCKASIGSYGYAIRQSWYKDFIEEQFPDRTKNWSDETAKEEGIKFKSLAEWQKKSIGSYTYARKQSWFLEFRSVQFPDAKTNWTNETAKEEGRKYNSISEWQKNNIGSYGYARVQSWFDEFRSKQFPNAKINWTDETAKEEGMKHKTIIEWRRNSSSSYGYAIKQTWYEEYKNKYFANARKYWSDETAKAEGKKYNSISEWEKKSVSSYNYARKQDWYEQFKNVTFPLLKTVWTDETAKAEARKYKTLNEWWIKSQSSYYYISKQPWREEFKKSTFHDARKYKQAA